MPSPLGHALAGLAIGWSAEALRRQPLRLGAGSSLAVTCAALAVCPDLDLLYPPIHRKMTHSLLAVGAAGVLALVLSRRARPETASTVSIACALGYGSHLLMDWLGGDTKIPAGIQLLWPFSDQWFISTVGLFRATTLGSFLTVPVIVSNVIAVLRELALMVPVALAAFVWRRGRQRHRQMAGH